jgi:hypothetical protein
MKPNSVDMDSVEKHFAAINKDGKEYAYPVNTRNGIDALSEPFTEQEVKRTIASMQNNKTSGPYGIYIENFRISQSQPLKLWTELFNICLGGKQPELLETANNKGSVQRKRGHSLPRYRGTASECIPSRYPLDS